MKLEERVAIIKKWHPTWSNEFIDEMLTCPYNSGSLCRDIDKHNLNLCDSCPVTIY